MMNRITTLVTAAEPALRPLASSPTYAAVSHPEYRKMARSTPEIRDLNPPAPLSVNQELARCTEWCRWWP